MAKAKQLIAEAGYANGFTLTMPDVSPVFPEQQAAMTEALKADRDHATVPAGQRADLICGLLGGK